MYGVALARFLLYDANFSNHILATVSSAEQMSLFTGFLKGNLEVPKERTSVDAFDDWSRDQRNIAAEYDFFNGLLGHLPAPDRLAMLP